MISALGLVSMNVKRSKDIRVSRLFYRDSNFFAKFTNGIIRMRDG